MLFLHLGTTLIYTLVYVDDIIVMGNDSAKVQAFIDILTCMFSLKDLDKLIYFLGVKATRSIAVMLLNQQKYITDLLHCTNMASAKHVLSRMMGTDQLQVTS